MEKTEMDSNRMPGDGRARLDPGKRRNQMKEFLTSNEPKYRLARTIVQGIIGVLVANMDLLVGMTPIPPAIKPVITGLVMAILSPIMAMMGGDPED